MGLMDFPNGRRNVSPADSEESDGSVCGENGDFEEVGTSPGPKERPICPEQPEFTPYALLGPEVYNSALKRYTEDMAKFRQDVKEYEEEELANLRKNVEPGCDPVLLDDPLFNPGNYIGGINFSHSANSDRHVVAIDGEGRINIYSRSNISTYSKNDKLYWAEVGIYAIHFKKIPVLHRWGYLIEIETKDLRPFIQTQLDSKDRIKILVSAEVEGSDLEVEELCFHFINNKTRVQLDDIYVSRDLFDVRYSITAPF